MTLVEMFNFLKSRLMAVELCEFHGSCFDVRVSCRKYRIFNNGTVRDTTESFDANEFSAWIEGLLAGHVRNDRGELVPAN